MANLFPKWVNHLRFALPLTAVVLGGLAFGGVSYFASPSNTDVGYRPLQPVAYSHKLHAGDLDIDCRYCHVFVESSAVATIPPTKVCMNCHTLVGINSDKLKPVRESWVGGRPIEWVRVHELPGYAYFDHSLHLNAGVGCVSCHGRVDRMEVVSQEESLSMGWCLDCHRDPLPNLRPKNELTNMTWTASPDDEIYMAEFSQTRSIDPPEDCTGCHR